MRKRLTIILCLMSMVIAMGCQKKNNSYFDMNSDYDDIVKEASGQTVSFYGWGGDDTLNQWIDSVVAPTVKDKYNIILERIPMNIDDILAKLSGEKQAGTDKGSIDMIWINGENFYSAKENGLLFEKITSYMPNYSNYVDAEEESSKYDFGYRIDGYEAPYSKAQMVFINDSSVTPETPGNTQEFLEYAKKYRGKVTYAALPDFTGSAFVRNIICDIVGYDTLSTMKPDKESIKKTIQPALDYLMELNKYLWNEGKTFPASSSEVDNMFCDKELVMTMSYNPYSVALNIDNGTYTNTTRSFIFDNGTIGNTNYIAIAKNSQNKQGAIVVINEILSPQLQASKYEEVKALPAIDYKLLSDEEKVLFDNVNIGHGILPQEELLSKQIPEIPANLIPMIEEIWSEEVVGK